MLSKQSKLTLKIYKTTFALEKLAQQYNLPGLSEEPIDNTSIKKEDESKRYDLSALDLSSLKPDLYQGISTNDIRKIILYELKANPEFPKQTIVDAVIGDAKEDLRALINEHLSHMPELRAKLPVDNKQQTLSGTPPEIKILPTQKDIEETKVRLDKEKEEAIKEYDLTKAIAVEKYKTEHDGKEPSDWDIRALMNYKTDPRGNQQYNYGYGKAPSGEDIKLDLGTITQGQYDIALKKLYRAYYSIEKNYAELDAIRGRITEIDIPSELPAKDPSTFKSYKDMVYDMRDRTLVGLQNIVANSVGYTLFGASAGKNYNDTTSVFDQQENEWFEDPVKIKQFLEQVPKVYDAKEQFWSSYGHSANDIQFWFERKHKRLADYDDSLKRTKESFAKGVRFLKMINTKLSSSLDAALNVGSFQYSEYIETTPRHREKLNALYLEIVKRIQDTSNVATRTASYYNNGMYKGSDQVREINDVDFSKMLSAKKTTQADILSSLTKLLLSSIKKVAIQINENELGPLVKDVAQDIAKLYIEERIGLKMEELPTIKTTSYGGRRAIDVVAAYGDPRATKVVDSWLNFAASSKLSTNFQSVIKYPEFIFKGDKEKAEFIIEGMKEKLGYRITQLLITLLPNVSNISISEIINSPSFVYRGPEETRKLVFTNKDEIFARFQQEIDKAAGSGDFSLRNIGEDDPGEVVAMPRFDKTKALLKSSIEQLVANEKLVGGKNNLLREVSYMATGSGSYRDGKSIDESNIDNLVNNIITIKLGNNSSSSAMLDRIFDYDATEPLIKNLRDRKNTDNDPITIDLLNADFFVSREMISTISSIIYNIDTIAAIDKLKDLKLQTDFSNLKMDVVAQYSSYLRQLFNTAMPQKEIFDRVKGIIKQQEELNKDFNAKLDMAIAKLKYKLEINKQINDEQSIAVMFSKRLSTLGGVGPYTIDTKFKKLNESEQFAHLPLQQLGKITNEKTMSNLRDGNITPRMFSDEKSIDESSWAYDQFASNDGYGTSAGVATAVIAKTLGIKDAQQVYKLLELCSNFIIAASVNISQEEIEYIFPVIITNKDAIQQQLGTAIALAQFAHNEGAGLSKDVILKFAKNPNFKDWVNEVDAIENFFDAYIKIKREGGARKFYSKNKVTFQALLSTKAIKPGAMRRMELIEQAFENNTRINPSIEGFDSIKKLIAQTNYDMTAIEQYATFSKYNTQIQGQKLFKDPALDKLNWKTPDNKFRFRVLKTFDPYHFQVGVDTDCCQKLGGVGEAAAIDSYINPLAGVVVLELLNLGEYKLVSQSYFHYVPQTNGIILDNVEYNEEVAEDIERLTGYSIDQLYAWWAKTKQEANKYDYFLCGASYNKLDNDKFGHKKLNKDPRSFKYEKEYTDWKPSSSVDLLSPKFELPDTKAKKTKKRKEALFNIQQLIRMAV